MIIALVLMVLGWLITLLSGLTVLFHVLPAVPALQIWSMGITLILLGLTLQVGQRRY